MLSTRLGADDDREVTNRLPPRHFVLAVSFVVVVVSMIADRSVA